VHTDSFRAALWCVLIIGALAFLAHLYEDHREESTSIEVTTTAITATAATYAVRSPAPLPRDETPASYVGNVNTHKFHRLTCRHANCVNCTSKFRTREEAIASGYRPCGICDP